MLFDVLCLNLELVVFLNIASRHPKIKIVSSSKYVAYCRGKSMNQKSIIMIGLVVKILI